jgi:hypothetical protein
MGYTHYYYTPKNIGAKAFKALKEDVVKIIDYCERNLNIRHANGMGHTATKPVIENKTISFNGVGSDSHETLMICKERSHPEWDKNNKSSTVFNFCKTARKPYDATVVAVLIALKHHVPKSKISGDGGIEGFDAGVAICEELFSYGKNTDFDEDE